VLDVRKISTVTDFHVICTGSNTRHLKALMDACETALGEVGVSVHRRSGTPESGWMILDCLDFVVHLFTAKTREHYGLETLWKDAPRLA